MLHSARVHWLAPAALLLSAGCNDGSAVPDAAVVDEQLISDVRSALAAAGVEAVTAPVFREELTELGRALFFDKLLSGNEDVSCATCHFPTLASSDGRCLPDGVGGAGLGPNRTGGAIVPRTSPMVLNAHLAEDLFWDGRVDVLNNSTIETPVGAAFTPAITAVFESGIENLATQSMLPPTSRAEMRGELGDNPVADVPDGDVPGIWSELVDRVTAVPEYATMLAAAYPGTTVLDWNMGHLGNAIAAFEATAFARFDSPFQRFLLGDDTALTGLQLNGALEFYGPADCDRCHSGSSFSDGRYHNIGLAQWGPGRGDGTSGTDDFGREQVTGNAADRYKFRTPSLLNVELTAPYGHLGQFSELDDIVAHYRNPTNSLNNYDPTAHADDTRLIGSFLDNRAEVLDNLDPGLRMTNPFNRTLVTEFLRSLTAADATDMSDITPESVPSGLPVDSF